MGESLQNEAIYVAVNQNVRESKKTLEWTLKNLHVKKICLVHVHIPFSSKRLNESENNAIDESEVKDSYDSLYKYRDICTNKGVNAKNVDISLISGYGVGEGIVELIYQNNITKLVMGAAADSHYHRGMSITSRNAEYVSQHAPHSCKMWFICKEKLIKTKEGSFGITNPNIARNMDQDETKSSTKHSEGILPTKRSPNNTKNEPENTKINGSDTNSSPCPPHDYICPISMDIMRDPYMTADGHTYEGEQIKNWLRLGHQTSPKTGVRLAHFDLIPNLTLRSAIQDWLQKHPNYSTD